MAIPEPAVREWDPTHSEPHAEPSAALGFAEHALASDLEELIQLAASNPELARQSLPDLAALSDRFCDFVGGLQQRFAQ